MKTPYEKKRGCSFLQTQVYSRLDTSQFLYPCGVVDEAFAHSPSRDYGSPLFARAPPVLPLVVLAPTLLEDNDYIQVDADTPVSSSRNHCWKLESNTTLQFKNDKESG